MGFCLVNNVAVTAALADWRAQTRFLIAAAVLFAHNHPSGVAEPSRADEYLTTTLKSALTMAWQNIAGNSPAKPRARKKA